MGEIRDNIKQQIRLALQDHAGSAAEFDKLVASLKEAKEQHADIITALTDLREFDARNAQIKDDPTFSYEELSRLRNSEGGAKSEANRTLAQAHLSNIIDQGSTGIVDPNTLFNAAVEANMWDFDDEALRLATLAQHYRPSASHAMLLADLQATFGMAFELNKNGKLERTSDNADVIREAAVEEARIEVLKVPRLQGEIIYSRANNIANRNRETGAFSVFIDTLDASLDPDRRVQALTDAGVDNPQSYRDNVPMSYAYSTLADWHAMRGAPGWDQAFWANAARALELLATESKMATWYDSTARELAKTAGRLGVADRMTELAAEKGVDLASAGGMAQLEGLSDMLERMQDMMSHRSDSDDDHDSDGRDDEDATPLQPKPEI